MIRAACVQLCVSDDVGANIRAYSLEVCNLWSTVPKAPRKVLLAISASEHDSTA